jgi:hypothetical protein
LLNPLQIEAEFEVFPLKKLLHERDVKFEVFFLGLLCEKEENFVAEVLEPGEGD